eukprot:jgi/Orpsp1_1/1182767/evm.model.c7180000082600.1
MNHVNSDQNLNLNSDCNGYSNNNIIKNEAITNENSRSNSNPNSNSKSNILIKNNQLQKVSSWKQIYLIFILRLKIFLRNKTFATFYTLLPICISGFSIFIEDYIIKISNDYKEFSSLDIDTNLYPDYLWFRDISSYSSSTSSDIWDIVKNIEKESKININDINYTNSKYSMKNNENSKYIGGFSSLMDDQQNLQFNIYSNFKYPLVIPLGINIISNNILSQWYNLNEKIEVSYKPFDHISDDYSYKGGDFNIDISYITSKREIEPVIILVIGISISLSVSIFGPFTVKEREDDIIHHLLLNGVKKTNYWIGVLLSDSICLLIPITIIMIMGISKGMDIFNSKVILYTIVITILWVISSLIHQYIICFSFNKYNKISNFFIIINPILTFILDFIILIFVSHDEFNRNYDRNKIDYNEDEKFLSIYWIACFCLIYTPVGLLYIYTKLFTYIIIMKLNSFDYEDSDDVISEFFASNEANKILESSDIEDSEKGRLLTDALFKNKIPSLSMMLKDEYESYIMIIIFCIFLIALYTIILFVFEKKKFLSITKDNNYDLKDREKLDKALKEGPIDVYNEWKRAYELIKDFPVKEGEVERYKKQKLLEENEKTIAKEKVKTNFEKMDGRVIFDEERRCYIRRVVDDVTFGVNKGECLGLLGPNGAGKTTSISMITGLSSHTFGKIFYGDQNFCNTNYADLSLGFCSQHDALWKLLTVKETIQFYLNISGYPKDLIPFHTKALIEACGIESHANKRISRISGGTKRKLSLIISICSSPSYLILDEPTAGMDPFTRRYIWKLLIDLKRIHETSTILTTHSTEEAEALCERISILIKGRLVCIDTPRSIKMSHNDTYTLEIFTDHPENFEEKYVKEKNIFNLKPDEQYQLESYTNYQKYSVKVKSEDIANIFSLMEEAKETGLITQYNFGQFSIEQVFINFINNS